MRLLILKLAATLALAIAGGCQPPINLFPVPVTPQPAPIPSIVTPAANQTITVKLEVVDGKLTVTDGKLSVGDGNLNVGGDASITAKVSETAPKTLCPCCGETGSCRGLCGKAGCVCSRGSASAAPTVGNVAALPQFVTQTQKQYQCRNGVCGWYDVEVRVPAASAGKRSVAAQTQGGKIKVYISDSPACRAMRDALRDVKSIDFERGTPPAVNGTHWWPTAVKQNGTTWTPGSAGWHAGSLAEFIGWRASP